MKWISLSLRSQKCIIRLGKFMSPIPKSMLRKFRNKVLAKISIIPPENNKSKACRQSLYSHRKWTKLHIKITLTLIEKDLKHLQNNGLVSSHLFMEQTIQLDSIYNYSKNSQKLLSSFHQVLPSTPGLKSIISMKD